MQIHIQMLEMVCSQSSAELGPHRPPARPGYRKLHLLCFFFQLLSFVELLVIHLYWPSYTCVPKFDFCPQDPPETVFQRRSRTMPPSDENMIELQATTPLKNTAVLKANPIAGTISRLSALSEDARLERLGKKPRLNRSFGFMSILGFSCSALLSWEGVLVNSVTSLLNGGPAGVMWGFLINFVGTISVYAVLGELTSMAPTAAGQCISHPAQIYVLII